MSYNISLLSIPADSCHKRRNTGELSGESCEMCVTGRYKYDVCGLDGSVLGIHIC